NAAAGSSSIIRYTSASNGRGSSSPSLCNTDGFSRSNFVGSFIHNGAGGASPLTRPRSTSAFARSSAFCADSLKSSLSGSITAKYSDGFTNCSSELLSRITAGFDSARTSRADPRKASRSNGNPSARYPCFVLNQNDRLAPAAKNRALSVPVAAFVSQSSAHTCSVGAQSQFSPFRAQTPCPYCVIFPAIQ